MADVELANLILRMQAQVSDDIAESKTEVCARIEQLRQEHGARLTVLEERTSGLGLTKAQRTALWTGATALVVEATRHLKGLFFALMCLVKGVRP